MFKPSGQETTEEIKPGTTLPNLSLKRRSLHSKATIRYTERKEEMETQTAPQQQSSSTAPATTKPSTSQVIATPISKGEGPSKPSNLTEHSYAAASTATPASDATKEKESDSSSSSDSSDSSSNGSDEEAKTTKPTAAEDVKASPRVRAQPKKYADDYVTLQTPKGTPPSKRVTPKRASTSKGRTTKEPLRQTEEKRKSEINAQNSLSGKKRGRGCGQCPGCLREDCGKCTFCQDKPKFGGPGKKKQRCALRSCSNFMSTRVGMRKVRKINTWNVRQSE